jgi:transcriptional regulator with XRE-family HTH domain
MADKDEVLTGPFQGIGAVIRWLRQWRGKSQQELADLIGADQSSVSRWETGAAIPDLLSLDRAARALEVDLPEIFSAREQIQKAETDGHNANRANRQSSLRQFLAKLDALEVLESPIARSERDDAAPPAEPYDEA